MKLEDLIYLYKIMTNYKNDYDVAHEGEWDYLLSKTRRIIAKAIKKDIIDKEEALN